MQGGIIFADVLKDLGLPKEQFLNTLISFNIGLEFGQIAVILAPLIVVGIWFRAKSRYRKRILIPASLIIALIEFYCAAERIFQ